VNDDDGQVSESGDGGQLSVTDGDGHGGGLANGLVMTIAFKRTKKERFMRKLDESIRWHHLPSNEEK
jgi:hypothetical protein